MPQFGILHSDIEHSGWAQYRLCYDDHLCCNASRHKALARNSTQNLFETLIVRASNFRLLLWPDYKASQGERSH